MKKIVLLLLSVLLLFPGAACADGEPVPAREPIAPPNELIESAISLYNTFGDEKNGEIEEILDGLESLYPDLGPRWREIFAVWRRYDGRVHGPRLPEDLPRDDSLCIVVLGYQLTPDGGMRPELLQRLSVALTCAEQYPNAYLLCTGGHTAYENDEASEAGRMAEWLIENGIAPERVIVEDDSLTTTQNVDFCYTVLVNQYPSVTALAVVSSDYHVNAGAVLLEAESILEAPAPGEAAFHVRACAACPVQPGSARSAFIVGGLRAFAHRYR